MGYTAAMFLASLMLAPPMLLLGLVPFLILRRLRAVPSGWVALPAYMLVVCAGYAALFLYTSVDLLLLQPIQLERRYLGRIEASPLSLRSYEHEGFMDPGDTWIYALRPDAVTRLKRHCLPFPPTRWEKRVGKIPCYILSRQDDRTYTSIRVEQDRLYLDDGLH